VEVVANFGFDETQRILFAVGGRPINVVKPCAKISSEFSALTGI
jgi:hypothetical protein